MQAIDVRDRIRAETDNDIALLESGTPGRTVLLHADDKDSSTDLEVVATHQKPVNRRVLTCNAEITPPDFSVFNQAARHKLRGVDGRRKANSLRRKNDCRIDANHFTVRRNQRPTGVSRVQSSICLNDVVNKAPGLGS